METQYVIALVIAAVGVTALLMTFLLPKMAPKVELKVEQDLGQALIETYHLAAAAVAKQKAYGAAQVNLGTQMESSLTQSVGAIMQPHTMTAAAAILAPNTEPPKVV